jgi:HdeA/HdeB family protein
MRKNSILIAACLTIASSTAQAQVDLSAYADANGFINVQALTCAQLANTWQQDADMLSTWYSGWYNGLARKHYLDVRKGREVEHEVILYCKAHQDIRIIDAIAVVLKDERARLGIEMK